MSVAQLPASTVKLITSSQIITSVSSAVKELFENALDAGATSIEVKLVNYGLDRIELKDNGSGISKENTAFMALPHYTSKISNFSDLESLGTYGFRGEALNALCKVGQVTLTTATSVDPMAMVYTLDSSGNILESKPSHHAQGTTVLVSNLFKNLPVRRQVMGSSRRALEELKQVETVVKSLAVIKPNIRVTLSHNKCLIWQKNPCSSLQNSFAQLTGYSTSQQLEHISLKINQEVCVDMLIPKRSCDINVLIKSTPALSLVFVNDRPVTYKKICKLLHQQLADKFGDNFSLRKFAVCLFSVNMSSSSVDVNLEPNKTRVLLKDEDVVLAEIQQRLELYYRIPTGEVAVPTKDHEIQECNFPMDSDENCPRKRRKIDGSSIHVDHDNRLSESTPNENNQCMEKNLVSCIDLMQSANQTPEKGTSTGNTSKTRQCEGVKTLQQHQDLEEASIIDVHKRSLTLEISQDTVSERGIKEQQWEETENDICATSSQNRLEETDLKSQEVSVEESSNLSRSENLWGDIHTNDLNALSMCLDALIGEPESSEPSKGNVINELVNSVDIVGSEAWSMGHIGLPKAGILKQEPCGHMGGQTASLDKFKECPIQKQQNEANSFEFPHLNANIHTSPIVEQSESMSFLEESTIVSPQKCPKPFLQKKSPQKSPRSSESNALSQGLDSSLQSVSSQMGRRELAAFTKFAREIRPQIILENPGIAFTLVASSLAKKWQALSEEEREHYEKMARATATSKKVWKTQDKQKAVEWVKKLEEKKKIVKPLCHDRPLRKEVSNSTSLEDLRTKFSMATLSGGREHQFSNVSGICLLGQLEPSGTWVCLEKSVLSILNHSRLQEVVINHRLLNTHTLTLKPMTSWEQLNPVVLGEEAWRILLSLPCKFDESRQTKIVSADIITKNGFKIEVRSDNSSATLTESAEALNYYGLKELKETLTLARFWPGVELSECRPLRVINHIKSEAMRICRKSPSILGQTMVEELLEYWSTVMLRKDANCLHSKPILTPIYNISETTKLYSLV